MSLRALYAVVGLAIAACGGGGEGGSDPGAGGDPTAAEDPAILAPLADGLRWAGAASSLELWPAIRVDGEWRTGGDNCVVAPGEVSCALEGLGTLRGWRDAEGRAGVELIAPTDAADLVIEGLALEGPLVLPGATSWLSNGFQSWSQAGALALAEPVSEQALAAALAARGDEEVIRGGSELSWWHTWVAGGEEALVAGVLGVDRFKAWLQVYREGDRARLRLVCGAAGEAVAVISGATLRSEVWSVALGADLHDLLAAYGASLPSRRGDAPTPAEAGWNSWYDLWDDVDDAAVRANAALARSLLEPHLGAGAPSLRVVVDDGWQVAWGEWWPNEKFPHGLDGLAADLRADGFEVGVWLAPLLVDADSELVAMHPGWFVQGAEYLHLEEGPQRVLDPTHPEAAAHLAEEIGRLVGWGLDFLKIDFLFAGTWEGGRHEAVTGMEAYARALEIVRGAAGEDVVLLAVGAPGPPSLPWVDAWRVGYDIAVEPFGPSWAFVPNQARSIAARWPVCLATLCDADPALLRELEREEVETGAWVVALGGGAFFLSDDLEQLPEERSDWGLDPLRVGLGTAGAPAVPEDLWPGAPPVELASALGDHFHGASTHVLPMVWRTQDGVRVALNIADDPVVIEGIEVPPRGVRALGASQERAGR